MNISAMSGFFVAAFVLWYGVGSAAQPSIFLDLRAILLVWGGTLAATLIAFPIKRFLDLFSMFVWGVILKQQPKSRDLIMQIVMAAPLVQQDCKLLSSRAGTHPFLTEGFQLIAEDQLSETELLQVLQHRSAFFRKSYMADAKMLYALAKFPPAFGLLGTSAGMIAMMTSLGNHGADSIGPAMAIALVATFWGIALANLVFLPLADYANRIAIDDANLRQLVLQGLMMLKRREPPHLVMEKMNSFLAIHERLAHTRRKKEIEADEVSIDEILKETPITGSGAGTNTDTKTALPMERVREQKVRNF